MKGRRLLSRSIVVALAVGMVALPVHAGRLYFTQSFGDYIPDHSIATVGTNGSAFYEIYRLEQNRIGPLAVDSASRRLYWVEEHYSPPNEGHLLKRGDAYDCRALQLGDHGDVYRVSIALDADGGATRTVSVGAIGNGNEILAVTLTGADGVTLSGNVTTSATPGGNQVVPARITRGRRLQKQHDLIL